MNPLMKKRLEIFKSPLFLFALALLLLNDFYFKNAYGNSITGKLSDFAGLFIFPIFFTIFSPKQNKKWFILTAFLFIFWKSPWSNNLIAIFHSLHIPLQRTIDYTDLYALIILPFSYFYFTRKKYVTLKINSYLIASLTIFSFCATSLPPKHKTAYLNINKKYNFNYSKQELVYRLNRIMIKEIKNMGRYNKYSFEDAHNIIYSHWNHDTLGIFIDYQKNTTQDTIRCNKSLADIVLSDEGAFSSLTLITVYKYEAFRTIKDAKEKTIKHFEKRIIKKLKRK